MFMGPCYIWVYGMTLELRICYAQDETVIPQFWLPLFLIAEPGAYLFLFVKKAHPSLEAWLCHSTVPP